MASFNITELDRTEITDTITVTYLYQEHCADTITVIQYHHVMNGCDVTLQMNLQHIAALGHLL